MTMKPSTADRRLPWWEPRMTGREKQYVGEVIDAGFPNDGVWTTRLEGAVAEICHVPFAVAVTSGTAALFLSLTALGIGPGDEVIVPDVTFIATANAVTMTGATPMLTDVSDGTGTLDPDRVAARLTKRTRAIIPVHVSGRAAPMAALTALAGAHGLWVIEDAAEALGSWHGGKPLGSHGAVGCFSFSPNKTITCGQGGMVVTADARLHSRLRELKDQGRPTRGTGGADEHHSVGYNFKLTNIQAAVGLAQLEDFARRIEHLNRVGQVYHQELAGVPHVELLPFDFAGGECPQWVDVLVDGRDDLAAYLENRGIGTRKFWHPLHTQRPYRTDARFPAATRFCERALWLPTDLSLSLDDVRFVAAQVRQWAAGQQLVTRVA